MAAAASSSGDGLAGADLLAPTGAHPGWRRVPVFVRVKPLGSGGTCTEKEAAASAAGAAVRVVDGGGGVEVNGELVSYADGIIGPEDGQEVTWETVIPPLMAGFLEGRNVNLLAYGQTGTGKTHTLLGPPDSMGRAGRGELGLGLWESYGIFPRTVFRLLEELSALPENLWVLTGSVVELHYAGNLDLVAGDGAQCHIDVGSRECEVHGAAQISLRSAKDVLLLLNALDSRATASTLMNATSSRSHCIAALELTRRVAGPSGTLDRMRVSKFQFVDMAGSERTADTIGKSFSAGGTAADGRRQMEGVMTNFSLTMFTQAVRGAIRASNKAISRGQDPRESLRGKGDHVPVRPFPLPMLLSGSLVGASLTSVIIAVSQAPIHASQSRCSLKWGGTMSQLHTPLLLQPTVSIAKAATTAARELAANEAAARRKAKGKFLEIRQALVAKWALRLANCNILRPD